MAIDCIASDPAASRSHHQDPTLPSLQVRVITHREGADAILPQWERLAAGRVFLAPRWLLAWWDHYQPPRAQLWLLAVQDAENNLVGLAPLYRQHTLLGGREIRFLGSSEVCSDYLSLLVCEGAKEAVVSAVADYLTEQLAGIDRIYLEGVERDEPVMRRLVDLLTRQHCFKSRFVAQLESYRIPLPETWEDYLATLSRTRRQRVRQLWRDQFDTGKAQVVVADDIASLERGLGLLKELHQQRQNQLGHAGCFASSRFEGFLRAAAHAHLDSGQLRLQWIEWNETPVAVEFDLDSGTSQFHYCSGIAVDSEFPRPGWLGITAAIRHAIESGKDYFDFLRGDESYKSHWRGEPVAMVHLELIPPTFRASARASARGLLMAAKRLAKRLLKRSAQPLQPEENSAEH